MLSKGHEIQRGQVEIVDTETLTPQEHLLRKIDAAIDFNKIYEIVEPLYCEDNGRPSIDPVVLFKMVLIVVYLANYTRNIIISISARQRLTANRGLCVRT